ncbi:unnamed protein product [Zymoseptoria tritici ST99CH_1A5]|uniref:Uncharacterized protein n=2 Tax=Zymoseptoria tritici TaxID=1047171 RepID=A0A1X7RBW6_ZYMT9|nr:unnamed protein product [Zymoseptoria tritici ST99CH_3D7]SMY18628.1 unnamed protein product [Zymoseptoria tritici ST99CH_1A5]
MPRHGMPEHRIPSQRAERHRDLLHQITREKDGNTLHLINEFIPTIHLKFQFLDAMDAPNGYKDIRVSSPARIVNHATLLRALYKGTFLQDQASYLQLSFLETGYKSSARFPTRLLHGTTSRYQGNMFWVFVADKQVLQERTRAALRGLRQAVAAVAENWYERAELDKANFGLVTAWEDDPPKITSPFASVRLPDLFHFDQFQDSFATPIHGFKLEGILSGAIIPLGLRARVLLFFVGRALTYIPYLFTLDDRASSDAHVAIWTTMNGGYDVYGVSKTDGDIFRRLVEDKVEEKIRIGGLLHLLSPGQETTLMGIAWSNVRKHFLRFEPEIRSHCMISSEMALDLRENRASLAELRPEISATLLRTMTSDARQIWFHHNTEVQYEWIALLHFAYCFHHGRGGNFFLLTSLGTRCSDWDKTFQFTTFVAAMANDKITNIADKLRLVNYLNATRFLKKYFDSKHFKRDLRPFTERCYIFLRPQGLREMIGTPFGHESLSKSGNVSDFDTADAFTFHNRIAVSRSGNVALHARTQCSQTRTASSVSLGSFVETAI